jgi:hypothetical protein
VICTRVRKRIRNDIAGEGEQRKCGEKPQKQAALESAHREKRVTE